MPLPGGGRSPTLGCGRDEMGVSYYDTLLPVREPGAGLRNVMAGLRLPYRVLASIGVLSIGRRRADADMENQPLKYWPSLRISPNSSQMACGQECGNQQA